MRSIEKKIENEKAKVAMAAAVAAYRGPITKCPPGVPRGRDVRYELQPRPNGSSVRANGAVPSRKPRETKD